MRFMFIETGIPPQLVTYQTNAFDASDLTTYSFASQAIGTASSDRRVIVGIAGGQSSRTVSSCSIAGQTGVWLARHQHGVATVELWSALVTTGTTGTISVTWSGGQQCCGIVIWSSTGLTGDVILDFDTTAVASGASNMTVSTAADSFALGIAMTYTPSPNFFSWSSITELFEGTLEGSGGPFFSAASVSTTGASLTAGVAYNNFGNSNAPALLVSF